MNGNCYHRITHRSFHTAATVSRRVGYPTAGAADSHPNCHTAGEQRHIPGEGSPVGRVVYPSLGKAAPYPGALMVAGAPIWLLCSMGGPMLPGPMP